MFFDFYPATAPHGSVALPFVIPSVAEGSAVQYFGPNEFVIPTEAYAIKLHKNSGGAWWRDPRLMRFVDASIHRHGADGKAKLNKSLPEAMATYCLPPT